MAQDTTFHPFKSTGLAIQKETNVGTAVNSASNDAWFTDIGVLQMTDYTIPEASLSLNQSAEKSGNFHKTQDMFKIEQGQSMWEFETTLKGTAVSVLAACGAVFEDYASACELKNSYKFPSATYRNGASSATTWTILFHPDTETSNVGAIRAKGCIGTGFTLSEDINSEGGDLVCTIRWATGFIPTTQGAGAISAHVSSGRRYDTGVPKNIRKLAIADTFIDEAVASGGTERELIIQSWELNVNRPISRIGYKDITDGQFDPFGYEMTGAFEIDGSMTVLRNADSDAIRDLAKTNNNGLSIQLKEDSNFIVYMPYVRIGQITAEKGDAVLTQTIPFNVVAKDDNFKSGATSDVLSVTVA